MPSLLANIPLEKGNYRSRPALIREHVFFFYWQGKLFYTGHAPKHFAVIFVQMFERKYLSSGELSEPLYRTDNFTAGMKYFLRGSVQFSI